jgi:hypothetical protein
VRTEGDAIASAAWAKDLRHTFYWEAFIQSGEWADLPEEIRALASLTGAPDLDINRVARQAAEAAKKWVIHEAIDRAKDNLSEAAGLLGIKPPNLHRLINTGTKGRSRVVDRQAEAKSAAQEVSSTGSHSGERQIMIIAQIIISA